MGTPRRKYGNRKVEADGYTFDSVLEARRYGELRLLQRAGEITDLEPHPKYVIALNGNKVCTYTADFRYKGKDGREFVEDVKSGPTRTAVYRLKKKLLALTQGVVVIEWPERKRRRRRTR